MRCLRPSKARPWLYDAFTAETNWPRFLKPAAAVIRSVPAGRRLRSFAARFVLRSSFCCTGVSVAVVVVVVVVVVVPGVVVVFFDVFAVVVVRVLVFGAGDFVLVLIVVLIFAGLTFDFACSFTVDFPCAACGFTADFVTVCGLAWLFGFCAASAG